jgi:S-DNA-T family DNA segregation ATPase FtsK/SpoIIIE
MKRKKRHQKTDTGVIIRMAIGLLLIALGLILALGAAGFAGSAGGSAFHFTFVILGAEALILPIIITGAGVCVLLKQLLLSPRTGVGILLILLAVLAFLGAVSPTYGGTFGAWSGAKLIHLFGFAGSIMLLATAAVISKEGEDLPDMEESAEVISDTETLPEAVAASGEHEPTVTVFSDNQNLPSDGNLVSSIPNFDAEYNPPPLSLLGEDKGKPGVGDIKANANIIKRTFLNFGISVEMDEVSVGPTVTRYAIKPAEGVRLSKIISLQNNLELALAAHPVRIEAPIPGKSLVGIEVPNAAKAMVGLGGIMNAPEWNTSTKPLLSALGRDISGTPHYVNIAKMPHGLIAGATGSGKSVAIHAVITSLLYRNGPNQLRFIMVDPKRVELTLYNGIPHLLTPVITDPKKAIISLKWAAKEMDRRYNILEGEQVRDIDSYHKTN